MPRYRARHRAARTLLGVSGLLPLVAPAAAGAAPLPATASVVPGAVGALPASGPVAATGQAPAGLRLTGPHPRTADVVLHDPYLAKDRLAPGWTLARGAQAGPAVACTSPSIAGRVPSTYSCLPVSSYAVACLPKKGYRDVVTCVVDPVRRRIVEHRTTAPLRPTPLPAYAVRRPVAAVLADGSYCRLTTGGVAVRRNEPVVSWAACEGSAGTRLWQDTDGAGQYRLHGGAVQYRAASEQAASPVTWTDVRVRYWIG